MTPAASIVIPVYNQDPWLLDKALDTARHQTRRCEVIVVDDGSTVPVQVPDGVRLIRHDRNRGIAAAVNTGIRAMTTNWWSWLSSDDSFTDDKIERQLRHLDSVGGLASFHAYMRFEDIGDNKARVGVSATPYWTCREDMERAVYRDCWINMSTALVHRNVLNKVGPLDESYRYGQDWEYQCRIAEWVVWYSVPCRNGDHGKRCDRHCVRGCPACGQRADAGCVECHGTGLAILGARWQGQNLTRRIDADPDLANERNAENARIHARYGPQRVGAEREMRW